MEPRVQAQARGVTCRWVPALRPAARGHYHMYPTSSSLSSSSSSSSSVTARVRTLSFPSLSLGPSSRSSSRSSSRTTEPPLPKSPEVSWSSSETGRGRGHRAGVSFCLSLVTPGGQDQSEDLPVTVPCGSRLVRAALVCTARTPRVF